MYPACTLPLLLPLEPNTIKDCIGCREPSVFALCALCELEQRVDGLPCSPAEFIPQRLLESGSHAGFAPNLTSRRPWVLACVSSSYEGLSEIASCSEHPTYEGLFEFGEFGLISREFCHISLITLTSYYTVTSLTNVRIIVIVYRPDVVSSVFCYVYTTFILGYTMFIY
jgi:hypothetical protein